MRGSKAKAALVLWKAGFTFRQVARLLGVTTEDVMHAVRRAL